MKNWSIYLNVVLGCMLIVIFVTWIRGLVRRGSKQAEANANAAKTEDGKQTRFTLKSVTTFVVLSFLVVIAVGYLLRSMEKSNQSLLETPEVVTGILIVGAITALMTVLFAIAAGFSSMNLTDPKQALGLPDGSIRAMIALVLILIFIIFGIHLFRKVGFKDFTYLGAIDSVPSSMTISNRPIMWNQRERTSTNDVTQYDIWIEDEVSQDGQRLAQQLLTTVGTLVVAVAGFYFGSTATSSAVKQGQEQTVTRTASNPVIEQITPARGSNGQTIDPFTIIGTDFTTAKAVRLVRGNDAMTATGILSSPTEIRCKIVVDKGQMGDKWDVIVENEDGKQARLAEGFAIV